MSNQTDKSGLTNEDLEKMSKKILGNNFLGVFPCDSTPETSRKKNFSVIFNLSKHNENGTHFVAILKTKKSLIYFDSYGKICDNKYILYFLKKHSSVYTFNNFQIQSSTSFFCGIYCLGFLLACQKLNFSLETFLNYFSTNKNCNDILITNFIVSQLK